MAPFAEMIVRHLVRHHWLAMFILFNRKFWPLTACIQFIQDQVEDLIQRLLADIAPFRFGKVWFNMLLKLRFVRCCWNSFHGLAAFFWPPMRPCSILRTGPWESLS